MCGKGCTWLWERACFLSHSRPLVDNTSKPTRSRWACTFRFPSGQTVLDSTPLLKGTGSTGLCVHMRLSGTCEQSSENSCEVCSCSGNYLWDVAQVKPSGAQHVTPFPSCRPQSQRPRSASPRVSQAESPGSLIYSQALPP